MAIASLESNLLKWSAKAHFLTAGICHLAEGNIDVAAAACDRYKSLDVTFADTREGTFLTGITQARACACMQASRDLTFLTGITQARACLPASVRPPAHPPVLRT